MASTILEGTEDDTVILYIYEYWGKSSVACSCGEALNIEGVTELNDYDQVKTAMLAYPGLICDVIEGLGLADEIHSTEEENS